MAFEIVEPPWLGSTTPGNQEFGCDHVQITFNMAVDSGTPCVLGHRRLDGKQTEKFVSACWPARDSSLIV